MRGDLFRLDHDRFAWRTRGPTPANRIVQERIDHLLTGRPMAAAGATGFGALDFVRSRVRSSPRSNGVPANSIRVGFIVTNISRPAEKIVAFYNKRGTREQ